MIPANDIGERIIAMGLRVQGIVPGKQIAVDKRNRLEIIL
jgi:hypothetical protein